MSAMHEEQLWPMIDGAIIGGLGGLVNGLREWTRKDWGQLAAAVLTAGFAGMLAQLLSGWLGADVRLQFAISGIAGYSGGVLLDDIVQRMRELVSRGGDALMDKIEKKIGETEHRPEQEEAGEK